MDTEHEEQAVKISPHPVAEAINRFVHRARDIRFAARLFVPAAIGLMREQLNNVQKQFAEVRALLLSDDDEVENVHGVKLASDALPRAERLRYSDVPAVIE
jgi:hypothetical protein